MDQNNLSSCITKSGKYILVVIFFFLPAKNLLNIPRWLFGERENKSISSNLSSQIKKKKYKSTKIYQNQFFFNGIWFFRVSLEE